MDVNFLKAYRLTVSNEGSLSNDPNDLGGLTWKGISQKMHPNWQGWFSIKNYLKNKVAVSVILQDRTLETQVQQFYYTEFWLKLQLDKLKDMDNACKFFDTAVNIGLSNATKFQQASVNLAKTGVVDSKLITALNLVA